jgi:hypothetical protein
VFAILLSVALVNRLMSRLGLSVGQVTPADPLDLIQFGVLGAMLLLVIFGWLWSKPSVDRILEDKRRVEAQRDAMVEAYEKQVIPALTQVNAGLVESTALLRETNRLLTEIRVQREGT